MPVSLLRIVACLIVAFTMSSAASGEDQWTRFRGADGSGRSESTGTPATWSDNENIVWRTPLPGPGASSPVLYDGRLYLTCYTGYGDGNAAGTQQDLERHLLCVDPSNGTIIWDTPLASDHEVANYDGFIPLHGYASGTPAVDETGVYVFYGSTGAAAFDFDGSLRWKTHLGAGTHAFGTANSPVIAGDLVIVNASVESGALVALRKSDGSEAWRQEGIDRSWNTPILYRALDGNQELALSVQGKVLTFDPATGNPLWQANAIDDYICPSIIVQDGILYAVGGRKNTTVAIRSGGRGDVTETHVLWSQGRGSNVSSPVFHEGHLYWASESRGIVYCADAKTGEVIYQERLEPKPDRIYASPLLAAGMIYYVSRDAGTFVVEAKPSFRLIAVNTIASDTSIFNGSPIVVGDRLILRSDKFLYAVGK
ncbi:MAG TPA: PQQ-like beta-propeller repeat protein [Pirellulaceae bacterium]|nr:PQQ-like beta-propeller repeat protein [Pirellulaceae bacterium]